MEWCTSQHTCEKELKIGLGLADIRKGAEEEAGIEVAFKDVQHLTCVGRMGEGQLS